jgi:multidrug efflux pump subunit AcrA (membrane-fusion protein)
VAVVTRDLAVAESDARRLKAWVGYLTLTAPFDGVIVARNANTGDFVLPATGDPTAMSRAPDLSPARAAPIYVVDRLDVVRIFVDIPEEDANYVQKGTKASVLVRAFRDQPLAGEVTRTAWALNIKSRTLRAEIDLPNPNSQLLPGMYAYANVTIHRPGVRALPLKCIITSGEQTFCMRHENGRAVRTEIQTGASDGQFIEVTNRRVKATESKTGVDPWVPFDGSEEVIVGDLSVLADGTVVKAAAASGAADVASAAVDRGATGGRKP